MGTWSVALHGSDFAADLKADFAALSRLPQTDEALVAQLVAANPAASDQHDPDHTVFWLVLADRLHAYGISHEEAFERATEIVSTGRDLATMRELEMTERDLAKRSAVIAGLADALRHPHPKPKSRKMLQAPEPHPFAVGAVLVYPTDHGDIRNPYFGSDTYYDWKADGWGSAVVIAQGHVHGYFAWSAIARLSAHGARRPALARCLASAIETQPIWMEPDGEGTLAIESGSLPPAHVKRMGLEAIGRLAIDPERLRALPVQPQPPGRTPFPTVVTVFRWWTKKVWTRFQFRMPEEGVPRAAVTLASLAD